MTVESNARFIDQLNETYPRDRDLIKEGDNHIRLIKNVLKNTMPSFNSSTTMSTDKLTKIDSTLAFDGTTAKFISDVRFDTDKRLDMGDNRITNLKDPVEDTDAVSLKFVKNAIGGVAWPVGSIFMSVDERDPNTLMGFGTWSRIEGRFLVGSGTSTDDSGVTRTFGTTHGGGNYLHKITVDELPNHNHGAAGTSVYSVLKDINVPPNTTTPTISLGKIPIFRVSGRCALLTRAVMNVGGDGVATNSGVWVKVTKNGALVGDGSLQETVRGSDTNTSVFEFPFDIYEAGDFTVEWFGYNSHHEGTARIKHVTLSVSEVNPL